MENNDICMLPNIKLIIEGNRNRLYPCFKSLTPLHIDSFDNLRTSYFIINHFPVQVCWVFTKTMPYRQETIRLPNSKLLESVFL